MKGNIKNVIQIKLLFLFFHEHICLFVVEEKEMNCIWLIRQPIHPQETSEGERQDVKRYPCVVGPGKKRAKHSLSNNNNNDPGNRGKYSRRHQGGGGAGGRGVITADE